MDIKSIQHLVLHSAVYFNENGIDQDAIDSRADQAYQYWMKRIDVTDLREREFKHYLEGRFDQMFENASPQANSDDNTESFTENGIEHSQNSFENDLIESLHDSDSLDEDEDLPDRPDLLNSNSDIYDGDDCGNELDLNNSVLYLIKGGRKL